MDFESQFEKIAKDIRDREDKEMALAFTNVVGSLLRENGVFVKTSRYELETDNEADKNKYIIKKEYRVSFDGLDFTEHDKRFKDEIEDLRKKLRESKDYITRLKHDLEEMEQKHEDEIEKFKENMMSVIRDDMKPYRDPNDMKIRIAELESELEVKDNLLKIKNGLCGNDVEFPCEPISVAEMLINAKIEYEPTSLQKSLFKTDGKCLADKYSNDDLEQIAEHLLVYCKHNKESEE